ncbi:hypothetical protein M0811_08143 [Anaeramoeba ignava]|uniref:Uncharacterized protein n=1 Tax=Anaeramoeba ignava TaxID=1746090 RepID=A0A9Q0LJX8_ANAIG|nr:hypothetical protein M0811_08143 [Anaeramoeba ignava]
MNKHKNVFEIFTEELNTIFEPLIKKKLKKNLKKQLKKELYNSEILNEYMKKLLRTRKELERIVRVLFAINDRLDKLSNLIQKNDLKHSDFLNSQKNTLNDLIDLSNENIIQIPKKENKNQNENQNQNKNLNQNENLNQNQN